LTLAKFTLDEKNFRWMLNESAMATEKLAEGVRVFRRRRAQTGSADQEIIPINVQDETKARRISVLWLGVREEHIQSDLQRAHNDARGLKDKRISLSLNVNWNKSRHAL